MRKHFLAPSPEPTSPLTPLKRSLFREKKKVFKKPSVFVCFGILKHLERTSFHFPRPEIFQGMLIFQKKDKASFINRLIFKPPKLQIPELLDYEIMFHRVSFVIADV